MLNPGQHRLLINVPVPAPGWNLSGNARHLGEKRGGGGGGEEEEKRKRGADKSERKPERLEEIFHHRGIEEAGSPFRCPSLSSSSSSSSLPSSPPSSSLHVLPLQAFKWCTIPRILAVVKY